MKIEQLVSKRSGNSVKNQFILTDNVGNRYFQSYDSIIIKWDTEGNTVLDEYFWDCSTTTGKYRNQLLGEGIAETRRKIEDGTYTLADLN